MSRTGIPELQPGEDVKSARPRWTRARARRLLVLAGAADSHGRLDTGLVADMVGRSRRTVQRWFRGHPNSLLPEAARARISAAVSPDDDVLRKEQKRVRYAADAVERARLPKGRLVPESWHAQGWFDEHLVAVVALSRLRLRQVSLHKFHSRAVAELRRHGQLVDVVTVGGKFEAELVAAGVLDQVGPWRVQVAAQTIAKGRTRVWADDAPPVDLARIAVTKGVRGAPVNR